MRIYEVDSSGTDLVLLFRNEIAKYDHAGQPAAFSWADLNSQLQGANVPLIDYKSFNVMFHQNPELWKSVVRRYDGDGVELNTKAKMKRKPTPSTPDKRRAKIAKMAKSAASKRQR
jgi:hypothetical protein